MQNIAIKAKRALRSIKYAHIDRFVFIHINKTGGTSVERALKILCEHKTALEKIEEIGWRNWNKKLTFTVIRNPWDKVVSHYHFRVDTNQGDLGVNPIDFKEWVKKAYGNQDTFYYDDPKMFMPQINWIADKFGNILVEEIIRFESLKSEFDVVLEKLGKGATLPHLKKSNRVHYCKYYDEETTLIIRNWFEEDIERFGYQF